MQVFGFMENIKSLFPALFSVKWNRKLHLHLFDFFQIFNYLMESVYSLFQVRKTKFIRMSDS